MPQFHNSLSSWITSVFCNPSIPPPASEFQCDIEIDTDGWLSRGNKMGVVS